MRGAHGTGRRGLPSPKTLFSWGEVCSGLVQLEKQLGLRCCLLVYHSGNTFLSYSVPGTHTIGMEREEGASVHRVQKQETDDVSAT